ncbi:MAG: hypothetical protein HWN67_22095 [Candidatus Helarchaeota archaeon]|nr:hypothetical protein [Candidatus Helarchaeota archaeon]
MGKFRSVRTKENIKCDNCGQMIGDGDMYLFNEEENVKLCHFCNYKMQKKSTSSESSSKPTGSGTEDFKKSVSRLDKLIEDTMGKKEE